MCAAASPTVVVVVVVVVVDFDVVRKNLNAIYTFEIPQSQS